MALKFLNKKGWHTGSLRNIENVWKAEQKHDAEQKKLEEVGKQIQEERERNEFCVLQQQAGLVPSQERLDFLYDSGLAVGKGGNSIQSAIPKTQTETTSSKQQEPVPGAVFEYKPQSANDAWRKLHSDPLLLIREREQEALAWIKNNPVQMARIHKSVEEKKKHKEEKHKKHSSKYPSVSEEATSGGEEERSKTSRQVNEHHKKLKHSSRDRSDSEGVMSEVEEERSKRSRHVDDHPRRSKHSSKGHSDFSGVGSEGEEERRKRSHADGRHRTAAYESEHGLQNNPSQTAPKLAAEEKAGRAREMQLDAELHEEQRWKRLKKASEADAQEANQAKTSSSNNFLAAAQKSVYGTEKGGSSTVEESVRRRTYYLQGKSDREGNAFRR